MKTTFAALLFITLFTAVFAGKKVKPDFVASSYNEIMDGKTAFIMFYAPWCGHCKKMKPDWHKAMRKVRKHKFVEMGKVDCTSDGGKPLCEENGVKGYPTIMYGDPTALESYEGGRDKDTLVEFAKNLKPVCNVDRIENCDDEAKAQIDALMELPLEDLKSQVEAKLAEIEKAEETFKEATGKLQDTYQALQAKKDSDIAEIKSSMNMGMMKAAVAHLKDA